MFSCADRPAVDDVAEEDAAVADIAGVGDFEEYVDCVLYDDVAAAACGARNGGFLTCAVYDKIGCGDPLKWESFAAECDYSVREF